MQKSFGIEQGVPEIWEFKVLGMILLRETKKRKKYHCVTLIKAFLQQFCAKKESPFQRISRRKFNIESKSFNYQNANHLPY